MSATESVPSPPTKASGWAAKDPAKRRKTLLILALAFVLAGMVWLLLWLCIFSRRETTDNAYVGGHQVTVSARVAGSVLAILADDTQYVQAGQVLLRLDPTDAAIRLAQARAALAEAVRQVRQQQATATAADAALASRRIDLAKVQADLQRRRPLAAAQAEAPETLQHLRDAVAQAHDALTAAQAQATAAQALVEGVSIAQHPAVLQARAQFRAAWIAAQRNTIYAPVSGYVAQRSVQLGNSIQPGQPLMTIVPLHHLWVDANFKESQLRYVRIGQPATIVSDLYGHQVVYHGKVSGLGAGTGSVFSLLPAQNATGNWIKVVQRIPVRLSLDDRELDQHPLRIGLSTEVSVDISDARGTPLSSSPEQAAPAQADIDAYQPRASGADADADAIIRANLGSSSTHPAPRAP